jgi:hypothetical protein
MHLSKLGFTVLLLTASPVFAHDVAKGPHGGPVVEAGSHHLELVAKGNGVEVFITDHNDKQMASTGFKGVAILTISGKAERIVLESTDASRLNGMSPVAISEEVKGVVQLTTPDGKTAQGRFH